eukprot:3438058-Pleurochrysis_carterae.AAC.4
MAYMAAWHSKNSTQSSSMTLFLSECLLLRAAARSKTATCTRMRNIAIGVVLSQRAAETRKPRRRTMVVVTPPLLSRRAMMPTRRDGT